jgi:hypothetical protein
MNIKILKSSILALIIFALFAGFAIGLTIYQWSKLSLPSHVDTLAKFSAEMPQPQKVITFDKDGSSYVEVIGRPPRFSLLLVPSGPPAYIFDSTGYIRYWSLDVGDSPQYWNNWQNRTNSREVSIEEALELVKIRDSR